MLVSGRGRSRGGTGFEPGALLPGSLPVVYRDLLERLRATRACHRRRRRIHAGQRRGWNRDGGPDGSQAGNPGRRQFQSGQPGVFPHDGDRVRRPVAISRAGQPRDLGVAIVNEAFVEDRLRRRQCRGPDVSRGGQAGKPDPVDRGSGWCAIPSITKCGRTSFRWLSYPWHRTNDPGIGNYVRAADRGVGGRRLRERANHGGGGQSRQVGIGFRGWSAQSRKSLLRDRLMATLAGAFGFLAARAGDARALRRDLLHGGAAAQRDRRAGRAGRRPRERHPTGLREAALLLAVGLVVGVGSRTMGGACRRGAPVRAQAERRGHVRCRIGAVGRGGRRRRIRPRTPRLGDGSDGRSTGGVKAGYATPASSAFPAGAPPVPPPLPDSRSGNRGRPPGGIAIHRPVPAHDVAARRCMARSSARRNPAGHCTRKMRADCLARVAMPGRWSAPRLQPNSLARYCAAQS